MSRLFFVREPVCAIETGDGRTTSLCQKCGRAQRLQIGQLVVELDCPERDVWLTSGNAILVSAALTQRLQEVIGDTVRFEEVRTRWKDPQRGSAPPRLLQLRPRNEVGAAGASVEYENCDCGAVRRVSLNPLILESVPSRPSLFRLRESPDVLVFDERIRHLLADPGDVLAFSEAYVDGQYKPSESTFDGDDWSDLR